MKRLEGGCSLSTSRPRKQRRIVEFSFRCSEHLVTEKMIMELFRTFEPSELITSELDENENNSIWIPRKEHTGGIESTILKKIPQKVK